MSKSTKKAAAPKAAAKKPAPKVPVSPASYLAKHQKPLPASAQTIAATKAAQAKAAETKVIISGDGTMPLGADNWRRVPRGTSISVSADELAWLENSGVAFKRA